MKTIQLTQGKSAIVDDEDYEYLSKVKWQARQNVGKNWIATRNVRKNCVYSTFYMARIILEAPSNLEVDHINHDTLDNRRINLRLATRSQNCANRRKSERSRFSKSSSRFVGVCKQKNRWQASVSVNGKHKYIGLFQDEEDAARAVDNAKTLMHREFACLNFNKKAA
jgi:HNH endonuclease